MSRQAQSEKPKSELERLFDRWVVGSGGSSSSGVKEFKDFSELQRSVHGLKTPLPAQHINGYLLQFQPMLQHGADGHPIDELEERRFTVVCRFILMLHYQLGKKAGFSLSDGALVILIDAIRACCSRGTLGFGPGIGGGGGSSSPPKKGTRPGTAGGLKESKSQIKNCRELIQSAVLLIAVHLASLSIGMEQVLSMLYMQDCPPERKKLLLPVLHRVFRAEMLSTKTLMLDAGGGELNSNVRTSLGGHVGPGGMSLLHCLHFDAQSNASSSGTSGPGSHPQVRLCSLVHSRPVTMEEVLLEQLLHAEMSGTKTSMFGSAPTAVPLGGADNYTGGPGGGKGGGAKGGPAGIFTLLHHCETMSEAQIQHSYLVSSIRHFAQNQMSLARGGKQDADGAPAPEIRPSASTGGMIAAGEFQPQFGKSGLNEDCLGLVATYVEVVLDQLDAYCTKSSKHVLFTSGKSVGLMFVEAVTVEVIHLAKLVATQTKSAQLKSSMISGMTMLFYNLVYTVRGGGSRLPTSTEAPELREFELPMAVKYVMDNQATTATGSSTVGGGGAEAESGGAGETEIPKLHFGPEVVLECLQFLLQLAPINDALNYLHDIFTPRVWETLVREHSTFPLQFVLLLWRNRKRLQPVLPTVAPRVVWLLSRWPHTLLPVVRRLVPYLKHPKTSMDLMLRLGLLPLVCFVADNGLGHRGATPFESGLREAIGDWQSVAQVIEGGDSAPGHTKLEAFVLRHRSNFKAWDSLQRRVGHLSPRMVYCYRVVRPLLVEYSNSAASAAPQHSTSPASPGGGGGGGVPETTTTTHQRGHHFCFFDTLMFLYFFGIFPNDARGVLSNTLLDLGRWAAQSEPASAVRASNVFMEAIKQDFIPDNEKRKRKKELMRWASVVLSTALFSVRNDDARKRAAEAFEVIECQTFDLLTEDLDEETGNIKAKEHQRQQQNLSSSSGYYYTPGGGGGNNNLPPSGGTMSDGSRSSLGGGDSAGDSSMDGGGHVQTGGSSWTATVPLGAASVGCKDYVDPNRVYGVAPDTVDQTQAGGSAGSESATTTESGAIKWHAISTQVWYSKPTVNLTGMELTEQLHALVMAITQLARCSFSLKERSLILLNKVIGSVKKDGAGVSILTAATMCVKLLLLPVVDAGGMGGASGGADIGGGAGGGAMPLYSLLGIPPSTG